jgi:predicted ATPase
VAAEFPDGVSFVDLSSVEEAALVPASIAQAIGVQESGSAPLESILSEVLEDRAILLVLDNFEQVLGAVQFLADLLARCPRLVLLVTSRQPLHLRAEHVLPVRPLPVPGLDVSDLSVVARNPAVALFVDRGRACRPGFDLTPENVRAIAEICTRLDGLPLAIELAAAQLSVLTPHIILERLYARAPFVLSGVSDLPARHRTLRAAVASSYDLLSADAQAVFRWCGVFAGGFTSSAAADIFVDGNQVLDLLPMLAVLADNNLLQVGDDPAGELRFRWLETIRSFAIDHLTLNGELSIARRRHAEYYVAFAESAETALVGPEMSNTLDALEREYDNFRAVFHWALEGDADDLRLGLRLAGAMYRFWNMRGHLGEARQWLDRAMRALKRASPRAWCCGRRSAIQRVWRPLSATWESLPRIATIWSRRWPASANRRSSTSCRVTSAGSRFRSDRAPGSNASKDITATPCRCSNVVWPCFVSSATRAAWPTPWPTWASAPWRGATRSSPPPISPNRSSCARR